jgi:hypothetical protein
VNRLRQSVVGEIELTGEALEPPGDTGLTIVTYIAEPGSAAQEALNSLASWSLERQRMPADTEHRA